ncbi:MAG: 50S ribosomal protein L15 [Thermoguttaceae bacterium]|nr:50S ribosomal protein L15 [Thermoguttaceae bacterium]MDW8036696.1 50S ribosomal protein L15 [Thermoguttaceae bacterium]
MNLATVHQGVTKHRKRKRVGRGPGSGHGKTAGRGHKGQASRSGWSCPPTFEGGRMPLIRRIPKRGFHNRFAPVVAEINVGLLNEVFQPNQEITPELLREKGLVKGSYDLLKILGEGQVTKPLRVLAHRFSQSAKQKIEQAGGQVQLIPGPKPVPKNKMKPRKPKTS